MKVALVAALVAAVTVAAAGAVNEVVNRCRLRQYVNANKVRVLVWYGHVSGSGGESRRGASARLRGEALLYDRRIDSRRRRRVGDPEPEPRSTVRIDQVVGRADLSRSLGRSVERAPLRDSGSLFGRRRRRCLAGAAWKRARQPQRVSAEPDVGRASPWCSSESAATWWSLYKSAPLKRKASLKLGAYNHEAVFELPARGLTLRAFVPAKTAWGSATSPGASDPFRS